MLKICTKCKRELDYSCFSKRNDTKDGLSYICKECKQKYDKQLNKTISTNVIQTCCKCGKEIEHEKLIDGIWYVFKFCNDCLPNQTFREFQCKKCGKIFKTGSKPSRISDNIRRDYCPDCSSINQKVKQLTCPKCGNLYYATRTPDGRHFRNKRLCNNCTTTTEKLTNCIKCGKEFKLVKYPGTNEFKKTKYCSDFCASTQTEFVNGIVKLKQKYSYCKHCGKAIKLEFDYDTYYWKERVVCGECLKPKIKPEFTTRVCSVCGKEFKVGLEKCGNYSNTQYCSDECASEGFKSKCIKTCQERYGVDYPCFTDNATKKGKRISKINKKFAKLLDENNINYEYEFYINNYAYDFLINNTNILIEINPTFTHTYYNTGVYISRPKDYHIVKSKLAKDNGYICICIWDWTDWDDVISLIKSKTKLEMVESKVDLIYSKKKHKIKSDSEYDEELINKGYLPIYTDGFTIQ